jgi:4-oxalocrotonate tautomerase family enzyme
MPVVKIDTWPMEREKKGILIKKITDVFAEMGIPAEAVTVVINEAPLENWGSGGQQHSERFARR